MVNCEGDEEILLYFKEKMGLSSHEEINKVVLGQSTASKTYPIPQDPKKPIPKPIHEYPPYVLGPRDTWPPKYPNSMR